MTNKKETLNENRCRYCNRIIYGLTPCSCIHSEEHKMKWDKQYRRAKHRKENEMQ